MGLFNSSFYRSFVIGFMVGAVALFASLGDGQRAELASRVIPTAVAATAR